MGKIKLSDGTLNLLQELNEARRKTAALEKQVSEALSADTEGMLEMCQSIRNSNAQLYHYKGSYDDTKNLLCDLTDEELIKTAHYNDADHFDLKIEGITYSIVVDTD